jgi:hypothetical protein
MHSDRLLRDRPGLKFAAVCCWIENKPAFPDQIDHPVQISLNSMRQVNESRIHSQLRLDLAEHTARVGPCPVQFIDECQPGHLIAIRLPPDSLALRLHSFNAGKNDDCTIKHPQAAFDLSREVDVARSIDEIDLVVVPFESGGCGRDGDTALALISPKVHYRFAIMDLADLVGLAGIKEKPLTNGGFSRINVGDNPDIANPFNRHQRHLVSASSESNASSSQRALPAEMIQVSLVLLPRNSPFVK